MTTERRLPGVDQIIRDTALANVVDRFGVGLVKRAVRELQQQARAATRPPQWATTIEGYPQRVQAHLIEHVGRGLVRVFNMTGTVLHTNLGRAPISREMAQAGIDAATHPVTLEYDLDDARRGDRDTLIEPMLTELTGAAAATVVNNNAAALLLALNTLALGRSVAVSRGELIEIGGSFRLPELMQRSGCWLREIGTTNRTHPRDYADVIDASTGALLKVHPSNFRIDGFTNSVGTAELGRIAHAHGLPLLVDLGSGALLDLERYGLPYEPTVRETLTAGADVVTFSGDKLIGAVQAGLIVGRRDLIDRMRSNPLKRALRCDKVTLGILRYTLKLYQDPERLADTLPLLRMLTRPLDALRRDAERLAAALSAVVDESCHVEVLESRCQIGSGAMPDATLPSIAVRVSAASASELSALTAQLRQLPVPVIGRVHDGALWLDLRAVDSIDELAADIAALRTST
jgi:L-seryl-tRNA(Ser) seleniumtransferase